jgi:dethiobiotin synthetase
MRYFVTAIDTDSGKTLVSAILCEALQADYWKPVQAGLPKDSDTVRQLIPEHLTVHPETFLLKTPASPHASAKLDGVSISLTDFKFPQTSNSLIVEGAGGCLVPLNDNDFVIDLIHHLNIPAIVVCDLYLGSINHSLLTIEALKRRNVPIKGIIFNGTSNPESERIILKHAQVTCLLKVDREPAVDGDIVKKYAARLKENWND